MRMRAESRKQHITHMHIYTQLRLSIEISQSSRYSRRKQINKHILWARTTILTIFIILNLLIVRLTHKRFKSLFQTAIPNRVAIVGAKKHINFSFDKLFLSFRWFRSHSDFRVYRIRSICTNKMAKTTKIHSKRAGKKAEIQKVFIGPQMGMSHVFHVFSYIYFSNRLEITYILFRN